MIADFFTKPLQGNLFRKFRDIILGYKHIDTLHEEHDENVDLSPQERVRKENSYKTVNGDDENPSLKCDSRKAVTWAEIVSGNQAKE